MTNHELATKLTAAIVTKNGRQVCNYAKEGIQENLEQAANDNNGTIPTPHLSLAVQYAEIDSKEIIHFAHNLTRQKS